MAAEAVEAAGVLSVQLESVEGLPALEREDVTVVQVVVTLLQGSRREQRVSTPLVHAQALQWPEDEVLEFGGVLQSARLFVDVCAHHGAEMPRPTSAAGLGLPAPVHPPAASSLLGKVALCVAELPTNRAVACTRRLLRGNIRLRAAYSCVQGVPARPTAVHLPPVSLAIRGSAPGCSAPATAPVGAAGNASVDGVDAAIGHAAGHQVQKAPSILVSGHGEGMELGKLVTQLQQRVSGVSSPAAAESAPAHADADPEEELRHMPAEEKARMLRLHRALVLISHHHLMSLESLLLSLMRRSDQPQTSNADSASASPLRRRASWGGQGATERGPDALLHEIRVSDNRIFDDNEYSEFVSDYTREDHLERIESPVHRSRRQGSLPARRLSRPQSTAHSSTSGKASPLSFAAAAAENRLVAEGAANVLRPSLAASEDGSVSLDGVPLSMDSLALSCVPFTANVPRGPQDPKVAELMELYAPTEEGRPEPKLLAWDFDIFKLEDVLGPATLPFVCLSYMRTLPMFTQLPIDHLDFARFLAHIATSYRPLAYHTSTHAADALQAMAHLLHCGVIHKHVEASPKADAVGEGDTRSQSSTEPAPAADAPHLPGVDSWWLTGAELLGLLVGTAVHDVDHTGHNNAFHVATGSELAITYNDVSVLENHHCAFAFRAMQHAGRDFASKLDPLEYKEFRETVISVVLGTDMSKHFDHVHHLRTTVTSSHGLDLASNVSDRRFLMQTSMHAADISNACRPTRLAVEWANRVTTEFYAQGDEERRLGLPQTKFFDRHNAQLAKSQLGFFDFIVLPLYEHLSKVVNCGHMLSQLAENRDYWAARKAEDEVGEVLAVPLPHSVEGGSETAAASPGNGAPVEDDDEREDAFGDPGALPPPRLTASALAAAAGFKPAHADEDVHPGQHSVRSRSNSVSSNRSRERRPSVASIPETEELESFDDDAEQRRPFAPITGSAHGDVCLEDGHSSHSLSPGRAGTRPWRDGQNGGSPARPARALRDFPVSPTREAASNLELPSTLDTLLRSRSRLRNAGEQGPAAAAPASSGGTGNGAEEVEEAESGAGAGAQTESRAGCDGREDNAGGDPQSLLHAECAVNGSPGTNDPGDLGDGGMEPVHVDDDGAL